ncbi:caspase family protein [Flammeovirga sp. EKP202]|uniref:caspase family protein n=1 Tax=Flammeovirga sp. EKP202 TaxID=2770592 RepID=UPI00165F7D48|nr:caspase family protein [Flammeovirga sp. EKP202]MBD0405438.1 caspase family protein [Flammeovirga sp. EKP202]
MNYTTINIQVTFTFQTLLLILFAPILLAQEDGLIHDELVQSNQYALIIGSNKYEGKPMWPDLDNAENDAKSISKVLSSKYNFKTTILLSPKREQVEKSILSYQDKLKEEDRFLIYIAGHGDFDEENFDDGFLVFKDSKTTRRDPTRSTYLQYRKLNGMLNALKARHVAIVLDVCFGGSFNTQLRSKQKFRGKIEEEIITANFLRNKMNKTTRVYLTSGALERVADGVDGHSPFCKAVLEFLEEDEHQLFTLSDLHQQTKRSVSESLYGSFGKDELGSEFIFSTADDNVMSNIKTDNSISLSESVASRGQGDSNKYIYIIIGVIVTLGGSVLLYSYKQKKIIHEPEVLEFVINKVAPPSIRNEKGEVFINDDVVLIVTESNKPEVDHLFSLYEIHSKNLQQVELTMAKYGDNPPTMLFHRKETAEQEIQKVIDKLKTIAENDKQ